VLGRGSEDFDIGGGAKLAGMGAVSGRIPVDAPMIRYRGTRLLPDTLDYAVVAIILAGDRRDEAVAIKRKVERSAVTAKPISSEPLKTSTACRLSG
jgi:hypothetical protein